MITVKVRKEEILEALAKHQERYQVTRAQLVEAYKKKAAEYQVLFAEYAQKKATNTLTEDEHQPDSPYLSEDRNEAYASFIAMVRSHIDSSVDLDYKEYSKLLLDKWEWTTRYIAMLNAYDLTDAAAMYVGEG